ncbi:MAG: hypothetical protein VX745_11805 [Pseudomonadota bacterium]|nr:hypothetical protein [Pseudomonadota bacterium]
MVSQAEHVPKNGGCRATLVMVGGDLGKAVEQLKSMQDLGVTPASLVTMNQGLQPHKHVDAIKRSMDIAGSLQS